uniref:GST N-terminal domain-containing protein n=1 Tax=Fusarium oxysporum (strain Fo5176) TaxID=660025 RepID=A0A0D2XY81_FUSOF
MAIKLYGHPASLSIIQLAAEFRAIARYLSSKYRDQGNDLLPAVDDVQGWALFEKFASVGYSQVFDAALQVLYLKFFNP